MYSKSNSTFVEINQELNKIYKYLNTNKKEKLGKDLFKKLIINNISQNTLIFYVINDLKEKIIKASKYQLTKFANLLSIFFEKNSNNISLEIYISYLNPILSIIQSLIDEKNSGILIEISDIYTKIVQNLILDDINALNKELNSEEKKIYEILQNFCMVNLKYDKKINQIIGSLCLAKLVENCPYVLKNEYLKIIIDNIISKLTMENFNAKKELLNCLISLILGAEHLFSPFAKIVFNKVIEFLTNRDWIQRKLSLNIIYTLSFYCKKEIMSLKENILNILNVLKKDKIKEIRDISILIIEMYQNEHNTPKKINKNKKRNNNLSSGNINNKIRKINYIKYNIISSFSPNRNIKNIKNKIESLNKKKLTKEINISPKKIKSKSKKRNYSFNNSSSEFSIKNRKYINRTRNFSFVNEKMKIKPDPNKSIFNTEKNMAFFQQNNNSDNKNKNLIIISNKEENNIKKNYNTFEGFYKIKDNKDINCENNIVDESKTKIDKNYNESQDKINKLIALDAKIKKENIKNIDKNLLLSSNNKIKSFINNEDNSESIQIVNDVNNEYLIRALLKEIKELSNKQISLLDLMEEIQTNTQNQINNLNIKIINLDDTIEALNEQLYILQNE